MTQQVINTGTAPNDGTGAPLRTAFTETNQNFDQVWAAGPVGSNVRIVDNRILTLNTNGNLTLAPNGTGRVVANVDVVPNLSNIRNLGSAAQRWDTVYTRYLDITGDLVLSDVEVDDLTVGGNLTVNGTTTTINTANLDVTDKLITVAYGSPNAAVANGAGILVDGADATITYSADTESWVINLPLAVDGNITATAFVGDLAGTADFANTANSVTAANVSGLSQVATSGSYSDLSGTPANVSAFNNDASYITSAVANVISVNGATGVVSLELPTATSDLSNDSGFITANVVGNLSATGNITGGNILTAGSISTAGNIAGNYILGNGNQLTGISYANISNTPPMVSPSYELHVAKNGNDTTGNGDVLNPYLTIGKALSMATNTYKIIVHSGAYNEDVVINNLDYITIASVDSGGISAFTPAILGNLTVSGTSTSIAIKNVGITASITHSASGSLYLTDLKLGQSTNIGILNKTGSGYLSIQNCNLGIASGVTLTNVNIIGSGTVVFNNTELAAVTVNNASASVSIVNNSITLSVTLTAGVLNVFDSYMYTLGNSGFYAVNATGGVLQIRNSILINPNQTPARVNLASPTVFAYDDIYFDRAGSILGVSANSVVDFQSIRLSGALSVIGNITGNYILGNGSQLTGLPATYGNANVATFMAGFGSNAISTTGNITASNFVGNISITGNVVGTSPNVTLVAGSYSTVFDTTGNLTLPGNTFAVNYANGTPVTTLANTVTKTTGSWTVTTGTNNYSFTVPVNNTYQLWVKGNIPNGIIVYNATVTVSNSNVPVLGVQYAWNYEGGGSPVLLTSIPAQIVGTAGAISNTAPSVGTTTNTFVFGIQNNTVDNVTVEWGYATIS